MPFVGTVPAIKPAAAQTKSGIIGVLATPGTVSREYTHALIHTYAFHCKVFLHGAKRLAEIAEEKLKGRPDLEESAAEITPAFRSGAANAPMSWCWAARIIRCWSRTSRKSQPWPVTYIDPAPAIARRVADVLRRDAGAEVSKTFQPHGTVILTSAARPRPESLAAYAAMGFPLHEVMAVAI